MHKPTKFIISMKLVDLFDTNEEASRLVLCCASDTTQDLVIRFGKLDCNNDKEKWFWVCGSWEGGYCESLSEAIKSASVYVELQLQSEKYKLQKRLLEVDTLLNKIAYANT